MCLKPSDLHVNEEISKISSFIKTGLFTLAVIFIAGMAIIFSQRKMAQTTGAFTGNAIYNKELPIYSVDTAESKIALSFDAAWGECTWLKKINKQINHLIPNQERSRHGKQ